MVSVSKFNGKRVLNVSLPPVVGLIKVHTTQLSEFGEAPGRSHYVTRESRSVNGGSIGCSRYKTWWRRDRSCYATLSARRRDRLHCRSSSTKIQKDRIIERNICHLHVKLALSSSQSLEQSLFSFSSHLWWSECWVHWDRETFLGSILQFLVVSLLCSAAVLLLFTSMPTLIGYSSFSITTTRRDI